MWQGAAWVASQVSRSAVVFCDQVMCQALEAHGHEVQCYGDCAHHRLISAKAFLRACQGKSSRLASPRLGVGRG
jgi:hypothetical protein